MSYTVDPVNPAEPTDDREAGMMAAEFRAIKGYIKDTVLKAITDNKTASDDSLKAINDKLNVATGNADLPAATGLIPVVAAIYKALYTETTGAFAKLNAVITKADAQATAIAQANQTIANLGNTVQQLSQSFATLNNKFNLLTGDVNSIILEFPVGYVLVTKNSANPATYLKYGTWKQVCKGTYLAGIGASVYDGKTAYNFTTPGATYGAPTIRLDYSQMPAHRHASNVLCRINKDTGQFLTSVDGVPTQGDGVKVIIGYGSDGKPIYGSESSGGIPAYYTRNYDGPALNVPNGNNNYGKELQGVPYTSYVGGGGTGADTGTPQPVNPVWLNPTTTAYYMWERTA